MLRDYRALDYWIEELFNNNTLYMYPTKWQILIPYLTNSYEKAYKIIIDTE